MIGATGGACGKSKPMWSNVPECRWIDDPLFSDVCSGQPKSSSNFGGINKQSDFDYDLIFTSFDAAEPLKNINDDEECNEAEGENRSTEIIQAKYHFLQLEIDKEIYFLDDAGHVKDEEGRENYICKIVALFQAIWWKGYGPEYDTWEPLGGLSSCREKLKEFVLGISGSKRFRNMDAPLEDPKNKQLVVFMDIVLHFSPKFMLMENVVDLVKFAGDFLGRYAVDCLVGMGYQAKLEMMALGAYGLPQFSIGVTPFEFEVDSVAYEEGSKLDLKKAMFLGEVISNFPYVENDEGYYEIPYDLEPQTEFQLFIRLRNDEMAGYLKSTTNNNESSSMIFSDVDANSTHVRLYGESTMLDMYSGCGGMSVRLCLSANSCYVPEFDTWEPLGGLCSCNEKLKEFVLRGISRFNMFRNMNAPLEDPKNKQLVVFMDIVLNFRPKFVLMENVVDLVKFAGYFLGRYVVDCLVGMGYQAKFEMMAVGVTPFEFEVDTVAYEEGRKLYLKKALFLVDAIFDLPRVENDEGHYEIPYDLEPQTEFQCFIRLRNDEMLGLYGESTMLDMYSGCGGMSVGLCLSANSCGDKLFTKWVVDLNPYACYGPEFDTWEPLGGLCSCREKPKEFMLRGISGFNRFRNMNAPLEDPKNKQLVVFMDIVLHFRPKFVLMENVVDLVKFAGYFLGRYVVDCLVGMGYQAKFEMMAVGVTPFEFEVDTVAYEEGLKLDLKKALFLVDAIFDLPRVENDEGHYEIPYDLEHQTKFQRFIRIRNDEMAGYLKMYLLPYTSFVSLPSESKSTTNNESSSMIFSDVEANSTHVGLYGERAMLDMYSGCGGMSVGLYLSANSCGDKLFPKWAVDLNVYAC
ncbi:hypothetical protein SASPL_154243 [Salvia splendens]|uniref:DNA (cytosine-5-)-methyltransferase n=1 Tax=Salvia splendens TaxID=180675 RepID=A0A8X8YZ49_SALSN|nr:hypothetical protein SASPL_154243 [Salvia splendens]